MKPDWLFWPETQALMQAFAAAKAPIRFVGGAVRDALLKREVKDVDAATPLLPEAVIALLGKAGIKAIPTGIDHGTVTAVIGKKSFEITTLRRDVTTDGRHAEVAYTDDWKQDAARRDFTINALYLSAEGELFDYFGGQEDLKTGLVRFIGNAEARIKEDYLRILRFFRFYAWYGKEAPDSDALAACTKFAGHIEELSGERIQQEMFKLFAASHASQTLGIMQERNILTPTLGFAITDIAKFARFESIEKIMAMQIEPCIKLSEFIRTAKESTASALTKLVVRLRLSNRDEKTLRTILHHLSDVQSEMTQAQQKRLLRKLGVAYFTATIVVRWVDSGEPITPIHPYAEMIRLPNAWQPPPFPVSGDDLIALGIQPGKEMGELLKKLEAEWEASDYKLTREQLLAKVK